MTEENKKTIISFIAGLLIGGLLVFIFAEPTAEVKPSTNNDREAETEMTDEDEDVREVEDAEVVEVEEVSTSTSDESGDASVVTGAGAIDVADQDAGSTVTLKSVEFPSNTGWIGVRDYVDGQMTGLLGVARFDTGVGLVPSSVRLLRPTVEGHTYAVVFYSDNGDRKFNLATDAQLAGTMETFKAE